MNKTKLAQLIAGIIGLASVILSLFGPYFSWWQIYFEISSYSFLEINTYFEGYSSLLYYNALGISTDITNMKITRIHVHPILLSGGITYLIGTILLLVDFKIDNKRIALISRLLMVLGVLIYLLGLFLTYSILPFLYGGSIFYGYCAVGITLTTWGCGVGFYMASGGIILALLSHVKMPKKEIKKPKIVIP